MIYNVIAFHDTYLDAYQIPQFLKDKEEDIQESYRRAIYASPEDAYKNRAHELEVVLIGHYDDMKGIFEPCEHKKICDLASLFPRGFLAQKGGQA